MPQPNVPANLIPGNEATQLRRVEDMERAQRETLPAIMAAIAPIFADIRAALDRANEAIALVEAQQAQLAAQQAALAAQQSALSAQVARIDALVNQQVTSAANSAFQSGISLGAGNAACATTSVAVPAGYSQALVVAISAGSTGNSAANCYTQIAGGNGGMMTAVYGSVSSSHARLLTGLSGGSISASTMLAAAPAYPTCMATTTLFAVFFR